MPPDTGQSRTADIGRKQTHRIIQFGQKPPLGLPTTASPKAAIGMHAEPSRPAGAPRADRAIIRDRHQGRRANPQLDCGAKLRPQGVRRCEAPCHRCRCCRPSHLARHRRANVGGSGVREERAGSAAFVPPVCLPASVHSKAKCHHARRHERSVSVKAVGLPLFCADGLVAAL